MTDRPGQRSSPQAPLHPAQNAVNDGLTPKRRRPVTENSEYAAFAQRVLRAWTAQTPSSALRVR